jgi:hypothetical protein
MLPRIRITHLLTEAATRAQFSDCSTHLRRGEIAGLLADGANLGLTRMAEAYSTGQLAWTSD